MSRPILLDTHALIWALEAGRLSEQAERLLAENERVAGALLVSPMSAWELGLLAARGRISLSREPLAWFEAGLETGLSLAPMPPSVLIASSYLPGEPPRDPADRIIVATARALDCHLMTRDQAILRYAAAGHLRAIPC